MTPRSTIPGGRFYPLYPGLPVEQNGRAARSPERTVLWLMLAVSFLVFGVYLFFDGNFIPTLALPVTLTIAILSIYRLDWGFSIFLGFVLMFDQFELRRVPSLTFDLKYFHNLNQTPYLPPGSTIVVSPMELHLLFLVAVWIAILSLDRQYKLRPVGLWMPLMMLGAWMLFAFVHGQATGGDFLVSLWEVRALVYFVLVYCLVPQIITNAEQVKALLWVIIAVVLTKILQGMIRFVENGVNFGDIQLLMNQEDAVLMVGLILFWVALAIFGVRDGQRKLLGAALLPILLGIYISQRRASYVSFGVSLIAMSVFLTGRQRKLFFNVMLGLGILFTVYLVLYWDTYGRIGMIAQQVKSIIGHDDMEMAGEDYLSNLYRDYENYNLAATVQRSPLIGIGFGHEYDTPMVMFAILERFAILKYIPHNSILWLASKTGAIGIFVLFLFLNLGLFKAARMFKTVSDPYLKAVFVLCALAVLNQMIVAYVEMQLSYYRSMIFMATLLALPGIFAAIDRGPRIRPAHTTPGP